MDWDAYVHLAFDELCRVGAGSPQVARRLVSALEDLRAVALPDRVAAVDRQLELLATAVTNGDAPLEPSFALAAGPAGHRSRRRSGLTAAHPAATRR